ncbi:MAG: leucine-rich repeat protein [Treponema sp.]|nr:leucine-rich repeat protein [Treponema sp.]
MKIKNLMIVAGTLLFMAFFIGCNNDNVASDYEDRAFITVGISDESARTVLPTALTRDELSFVLKGRKASESAMTQLGSWTSYTALQSMTRIELTTGNWYFTLEASKDDTIVLTSTISKSINYGNNSLSFTLGEAPTGNGSLNVRFSYPANGIAKVTAGLFDLSGNAVTGYAAQNLTATTANGKSTVTYNKTSVPKGSYILRFYLYQNASDSIYINTYGVIVRVAPGCATTGAEEIEKLNTVYSITYELNGGTWDDDIYIPLSYTNYTTITLPVTLSKSGSVFAGWFDNDGLTGQRINEIPLGTDGNKTYYAKWITELTGTTSEFYSALNGCNNGTVTVKITDTNPSMSYIRTALDSTGVKVNLDLSECTGLTTIPERTFANCTNLSGITLPSSLTSIADSAFMNNTIMSSIVIPNSVQTIGKQAFSGCDALTTLDLGSGVKTIGYGAFEDCSSLASADVPDSVISLGERAFTDCSELESVELGEAVTTINANCFSGCLKLTSVTMSNNVVVISNNAFADCKKLATLTLSDTLENIGKNVFAGCTELSTLVIPETVVSIDNNAFENCGKLTSLVIPDNVTTIGSYVFKGCKNIAITINNTLLNSIAPAADATSKENTLLAGCKNYTIAVVGGTTTLAAYCFYNCTELKTITFPSNLTEIGNYCFYNCTGLTTLSLPSGLTTIGNYAFARCTGFSVISLPNSVTSIGTYVLSACSNLINLTLSNTLQTIGKYAFEKCVKLSHIVIPDSVTTIGECVFNEISNIEITIKNGLLTGFAPTSQSFKNRFFSGCSDYCVVLSSASTAISDYVFANCSSLKSITIPDTVLSIGKYAFYNCSSLEEISVPSSVATIGEYAFYGCSSAEEITLPNSIEVINENTFDGCSSLEVIQIPLDVTSIGNYAFANCTVLEEIEIPSSVISIGDYAFAECIALEEIEIPDDVISIGDYAFYKCSSLENISIPRLITQISSSCFGSCSKLQTVTITSNVTKISGSAFSLCSSLSTINGMSGTWVLSGSGKKMTDNYVNILLSTISGSYWTKQ